MMSDLVEFLRARLDEDEDYARSSEPWYDAARLRREVEAKRRIVDLHAQWPVLVQTQPKFEREPGGIDSFTYRMSQQIAWTTEQRYRETFGEEPPTAPMIRALAAVYADHPDYREEWRDTP